MASLAEQFGALVRHHRERAGLSQQDLGDQIGRTAVTVGRIERGDAATTFESLGLFATALNVDVRDLFGVGDFAAADGRADPLVGIVQQLAPLSDAELAQVDELVRVALRIKSAR